jgi:hypothetical protein
LCPQHHHARVELARKLHDAKLATRRTAVLQEMTTC